MNDYRFIKLFRQLKLLSKKILLLFLRIPHAEIIQAEFSNCDDFRMFQEFPELFRQFRPAVRHGLMRVMGMNAQAGVDEGYWSASRTAVSQVSGDSAISTSVVTPAVEARLITAWRS